MYNFCIYFFLSDLILISSANKKILLVMITAMLLLLFCQKGVSSVVIYTMFWTLETLLPLHCLLNYFSKIDNSSLKQSHFQLF